MLTIALFVFFIIRPIFSCTEPARCNETSSVPNSRLTGHKLLTQRAESTNDCIKTCDKRAECRSVNFNWVNFICELNKADVHIAPHSFISTKGYVYLDNPWPKNLLRSCAQIQHLVPEAKSGYYELHIRGKKREVYCDMVNYGGGWTLVASISSSSNDHLLRREVNCHLPTRCVEFITSAVPCRKLSDEDIHEIATHEGTFRVDQVTDGFSAFYQIPAGAKQFNSECHTLSCPRIIVSHVYPYQWESNCRGIRNGYFIYRSDCHRVFDMHDNHECGSRWYSSQFINDDASTRILYGFLCDGYTGIFPNKAGLLFVK